MSKEFGLQSDANYVVTGNNVRKASSTGEYRIPVETNGERKGEFAAVTCIRFFLATPSVAQEVRDFQMNQFILDANGEFFEDGYVPDTPMSLLRHTSTVFGE